MNYKGAIFFDVDGTLIDGRIGINEPSKKTMEAIKILKEKGYLVLISTGRPYSLLDKRILSIEPNGVIASNGTYVNIDGKEVINNAIEQKEVFEIVDFLEKNNIGYILEGQEVSYVDKNEERNTWEKVLSFGEGGLGFTLEWDINDIDVHKIVIFTEKDEEIDLVINRSKEYSIMRHNGYSSSDYYRNKYSKGAAIEELMTVLDIDRNETYAFGDGQNDIEMLQTVKYGIAMGEADEKLLEHAYFQTDSVIDEGIYNGLKKLGLI